jgi:uncharacterized membrane protein YfcA
MVVRKQNKAIKVETGKALQMESSLPYLLLGIVAGVLSGLVGIGGGIIIVPALVFLFGMSQHHAQGTTLALLVPPIGILAAWTYYRAGYVDIRVAVLVAIGFVAGSFLGARIATNISETALERVFGVALVLIGVKMILGR